MTERLRQLEQQIEKDAEERQRLQSQAMKQERQLQKWNERYQIIKTGAREKMKERAEKRTDQGIGEGAEAG